MVTSLNLEEGQAAQGVGQEKASQASLTNMGLIGSLAAQNHKGLIGQQAALALPTHV